MTTDHPRRSAHGDRAVEWLCALIMVWWCVALSLPSNGIMGTPQFAGFAEVGLTQPEWAVLFGLIGINRCMALFINGRWPKTPIFRAVGATTGAFIFSELALRFAQASFINKGPFQVGVGVYGLLTLCELFSIYRAMHDARYYRPVG